MVWDLKSVVFLTLQTGFCLAIDVINPAGDIVLASGRSFAVEWNDPGDNNRFEIDMYHCGSYCTDEACGDFVAALCPYAREGCADEGGGSYDVILPEPLDGASGSGYKIGVTGINDESQACSEEFTLLNTDDDEYYLAVTSPTEGDIAIVGGEYTVEFDYTNGFGMTVDRFSIGLYEATGADDCGTYTCSLCEKHLIGCRDSAGDLDILIPLDVSPGNYRIRVGTFGNESLFDCSDVFSVVDPVRKT